MTRRRTITPNRRPGRAGAVIAATVALATLGTAAPALADETYWTPADESYDLAGHGYGHGRGMSQYGARGAAMEGRNWRQILDRYYPRTTVTDVGNAGWMRVLVTGNSVDYIRVSPQDGLRVRDRASGTVTRLENPRADRWEMRLRSSGDVMVRYRTSEGWKRRTVLRGEGEFLARGPLTLWRNGSDPTRYRGNLRTDHSANHLRTLNVVPLEAYVRGVVPAEMPATWPGQAVRAQAVAARTYAVRHRNSQRSRPWHVDDTISYQVYGGMSSEHPDANKAVTATAGHIVTYGGEPALTEFSSSSGGLTDGSALPYQVIRKDPFDAVSGNPNHAWQATLSARALATRHNLGDLERIVVTRRGGCGGSTCDWGGRIRTADLVGTKRTVTVSGNDLRMDNGLRSTWFVPRDTPIIRRWKRMGGDRSRLGSPRATEYAIAGGQAQRFDTGRGYHHARVGAHVSRGTVNRAYRHTGGPRGHLGFPRTDVRNGAGGIDNAQYQAFQRGLIYHHPDIGPRETHGRIAGAHFNSGGAAGKYGFPRTNVREGAGGIGRADYQAFQRGGIWNHPDIGARGSQGPILRVYRYKQAASGPLGFPDIAPRDGAGGNPNAQYQAFQDGLIYYHPTIGTREVHGPIADAYRRHRAASGALGFPTTHVREVPGGLRSDFQGGYITWDSDSGRTTVVTD